MNRRIGYCRVSRTDQNLSLQITALKNAGCSRIYQDHGISGTRMDRPEFQKALNAVQSGDTLVIWRLDRMSRSLKHLIEINETLSEGGAYFESLTEKIDTSTAMGEFVFHILGAVAQLEREIISERTLAGLEEAARHGNYAGRPRKLTREQILWAARQYQDAKACVTRIADKLNVHPETLRRNIKQLEIRL